MDSLGETRQSFLDVAKGIMALLVIFHHVPIVFRSLFGETMLFQPIEKYDYFYTVFFMPAFFLINGFTSNFKKDWKSFLAKNAKSLLMPFLTFGVLLYFVDALVLRRTALFVTVGRESYFYVFEATWFFTALFFARILQWLVVHYFKKDLIQFLVWATLMAISFGITHFYARNNIPLPSHFANFLHYRNGLAMGIFLWMGYFVRKQDFLKPFMLGGAVIYLVLIIVSFNLEPFGVLWAPSYTHTWGFGIKAIPKFILYSTTGSACILLFSYFIGKCSFLEYCGRNSGIIYGVQFGVLKIVSHYGIKILPVSTQLQALIWYLAVGISSIILSIILCKVFEIRWLRILVGRN